MQLYTALKKLMLGCGQIRSEHLKASIYIDEDDAFTVVFDDTGEPCELSVDCFAPKDWKVQE